MWKHVCLCLHIDPYHRVQLKSVVEFMWFLTHFRRARSLGSGGEGRKCSAHDRRRSEGFTAEFKSKFIGYISYAEGECRLRIKSRRDWKIAWIMLVDKGDAKLDQGSTVLLNDLLAINEVVMNWSWGSSQEHQLSTVAHELRSFKVTGKNTIFIVDLNVDAINLSDTSSATFLSNM